ncbi:MAG TPA: FlgO family outer membrane protein [Desulfopila sp.]|nr:FlgO family outer membrane protein [Desulfopila sp.]
MHIFHSSLRNIFNRRRLSLQFSAISLGFLLIILNGCSSFQHSKISQLFNPQHNLIDVAYELAEELERHAYPPLLPRHPQQPILTTTFVNNDNLNETSQFSRVMQEHLTSRFVQMGYTVREVKLRQELEVAPLSGEKILSRNIVDLQPQQLSQAVAVGTYSVANRTIYISARLIDPVNATILSSVDRQITIDATLMAMFGLRPNESESMDLIAEPRRSFMTRLLYR